MEALIVIVFLVQTLIQYPQLVSDELDEATRVRMELRAKFLNREMSRLLQELEQSSLERTVRAWGALLWAVLQQENFWALAGVLGLLLALWFIRQKRSCESHSSAPGENASSNLEVEEDEEKDNVVAKKEAKRDDANVEEDSKDGNAEDGSRGDTNKEKEFGNEGKGETEDENEDKVIGNENVEEDNAAGREERKYGANGDEEQDIASMLCRIIEERIRWPVLDRGCTVTDLIDGITRAFGNRFANHSYPVPQRAIGVGSAFEGWSPCKEDVVYRVLVPLNPPTGHAFHLEPDTAGKMPGKYFCVHVQQVHNPEEKLRRNEELSLLYNLCTGSYLDVEKTTQWFYLLMKANWLLLSQSYHWHLKLIPSSRSCKFSLTKGAESLQVEVLFGVQRGDSDIYVSSQPTEALFTPSTVWMETYAVAEMKFFRHIAQQVPRDSCHLKCLQLLARALEGRAFSTYILKTVVMHLLNTIPVSQWCRRDFLQRLVDSLDYLCCSLQKKQLYSFVIGNQRIPGEINLPPDLRKVKPPNLFWHLTQDPEAHTEAMQEYLCLRHRLKQLLLAFVDS
ncbi:inositol 1,4,5-trisphosphate receptor-interacting protein-like 1 [Empidonax traillii]|uniref:inositol 1,4,5-trisphosphate receptor-interacting protein-like 1 n=1 Tax=Empidonax traillii TaxID=164674 RepID=UPI000FFD6855|nr:inositol 1,4,5-trisphosphate receptor-interacting protein-like 1 [Empidonax traillii]